MWGMTQHVAVVTGEAAPARGVWNSKLEGLRGELEVQDDKSSTTCAGDIKQVLTGCPCHQPQCPYSSILGTKCLGKGSH